MKTRRRAYSELKLSRQRLGLRWLDTALEKGTFIQKPLCHLKHRVPVLLVFALVALSACKSPNSPTSPNSTTATHKDAIAQLNVITVPVALDLDGQPGPDGVALKLYASHASNPKAIRVRDGTLEILLFDGTFHGRTNPPPILRTATFTPAELRLNEFKSNIGWGYDLTVRWGTNLPTQRLMSVGARYTPPNGRPIVSRTSSVTVLNK